MENQTGSHQPGESKKATAKKAGPLQVALAVFWSFFGVRKHKNWQEDAGSITPVQVIIGGIIGAIIFVFVLIMIVRLVTK
jgi:hypothetical protein